jgi:hypothetical protein
VPNRDIVTDYQVQAYTTILAASIYSVVLFAAYTSYLPVALVTYFNDIPTIQAAHDASMLSLLPLTLILGLAARSFIFTPVTASAPSLADAKASAFNPATATLGETLVHNVWSYGPRTKAVIKRTSALMLVSGVNTFVQCYFTIQGVEVWGALAYAAVWVAAAGVTGVALGVVGAV